MTRRRAARVAVLLPGLLVAGCGPPDYDDASVSLHMAQDEVTRLVRDVADVLQAAGLPVTELQGERSGCGLPPRTGVDYRIGGLVTGRTPVLTRFDAAVRALQADGWTVVDERRTAPAPGGHLTKGSRWLHLAGSTRRGSTDLTFDAVSECVGFPDDHIPDLSRRDTVPLPE